MRILATILMILYGAATWVQQNDPDPMRWYAVYGLAALLCLMALAGKPQRPVMVLLGLAALVWAATLVPTILDVGAYSFNEVEREFGGLVVVGIGMFLLTKCSLTSLPVAGDTVTS
jgi:uncharacterized membrane protein